LNGAVGKAGLAPMFVWLANRCITENGRLALVLPRVCMSGISWEPIRKMLVKNYSINYIVVSYDPSKNWAWSENTVLSEILLVCTKRKPRNETVRISYFYKLPRSALETKIAASRILEAETRVDEDGYGIERDIRLGTTYTVQQSLLRNQRNWNVCVGFASVNLNREAWAIHTKSKFLGQELPLTKLENIVEKIEIRKAKKVIYKPIIGFDVATYQRCKSKSGKLLLDALEGSNISTLNHIEIQPNAKVAFRESCRHIADRQAQLLIAGVGRFWLKTGGLISVFSSKPVISNTMWTVKLKASIEGWAADGAFNEWYQPSSEIQAYVIGSGPVTFTWPFNTLEPTPIPGTYSINLIIYNNDKPSLSLPQTTGIIALKRLQWTFAFNKDHSYIEIYGSSTARIIHVHLDKNDIGDAQTIRGMLFRVKQVDFTFKVASFVTGVVSSGANLLRA